MKTFVTSDLHFGHGNIIQYEHRPFRDVDHMDRSLIKNWNQVVSKYDRVFVLGDVGFYPMDKLSEYVHLLNGRKTLIMGNHDRGRNVRRWMECGFDEVSKYPIILDNSIVLSHEPPEYFNDGTPFFWMYGHVHGTGMYQTVTANSACVCVERWGYAPVEMQKIFDIAKLK